MSIEKLERDGKVAVLVSPGFGAGWSTWVSNENRERAVFDPAIVKAVLGESDETLEEVVDREYPDEYPGGIDDLIVEWLPKGTNFTVEEYDGSESLRTTSDLSYHA